MLALGSDLHRRTTLGETEGALQLLRARYFIHVYAAERLDEAEYTLRVQFQAANKGYESTFPEAVLMLNRWTSTSASSIVPESASTLMVSALMARP